MPTPKRILILFSDTGGGHRSAGEAIAEAFKAEYRHRYQPILVDALKEYTPHPLCDLPHLYPDMVRIPAAWGFGYRLLNGRRRSAVVSRAMWRYAQRISRRLVEQHRPDMILSVHPLIHSAMLPRSQRVRIPFVTMVTDMVSVHSLWYQSQCDLWLVATESARKRALEAGVNEEKVRVVGMPVSRRHSQAPGSPSTLRRELGWPEDLPMVLLMGGGEGMGPLYQTVEALSRLPHRIGLVVVTGRNDGLKHRIQGVNWPVPVYVYGFEKRLSKMMRAATLLVTKAGPGTITEAVNAGLPMVLVDRLPGQEDGNVAYVVNHGMGEWAPGPQRAAAAVASYLSQPEKIRTASQTCLRIARPDAAIQIVRNVDSLFKGREEHAITYPTLTLAD
jgi:1,2-diacylglycerol 3-beta-galactosyltransferase